MVKAFPNPTNGKVTVNFNAPAADRYAVRLFDLLGNTIMNVDVDAVEGLNIKELDLTKEGGHSKRRVLHAKDATGAERALYTTMIADSGLPGGRTALFTSNTGPHAGNLALNLVPRMERDLSDVQATEKIRAAEARIQEVEGQLGRMRQQSAAAQSRLDTLLELKASFEGVS